jgi:hypothetical protein
MTAILGAKHKSAPENIRHNGYALPLGQHFFRSALIWQRHDPV